LLSLLIIGFLTWHFIHHNPVRLWHEMYRELDRNGIYLLIVAVLLMPVNWLLESIKWKQTLQPICRVRLWWAFQSVCAGVSIGIFMPNRVGEFAGKILLLLPGQRARGGVAAIVSSLAQFCASVSIGLIAFLFYLGYFQASGIILFIAFSIIIITIILLNLFCFNLPAFALWASHTVLFQRWSLINSLIAFSNAYPSKVFFRLWLWSALRYLVFTGQLLLLLMAMGIAGSWWILWILVCASLLLQSLVPVPAVIGLGLRFSASIYFIGQISNNDFGIIAASAMLWMINLIIPALAGLLFINKSNIMGKTNT